MTSIIDWFDPCNINHLRAFKDIQDGIPWPDGFLPEDIEFPTLWLTTLMSKITDIYIDSMLSKSFTNDEESPEIDPRTETVG